MTQHIKFFSDDEVAVKHFPPLPANKMLPDWYKSLPVRMHAAPVTAQEHAEIAGKTTLGIKGCTPVGDYITSGYIIRAASDIVITPQKTDDLAGFYWSSPAAHVQFHAHGQCPVHINKVKNDYIKIENTWRVVTPPGYSCYMYQPEFFFNENIKFFPAVVDTDAYQNAVSFPGVVIASTTFTIQAGDPLMVVFPFKRENWDHFASFSVSPKNPVKSFFERGYKTLFHRAKRYR
jgi:hypothetical protein